MTKTDTPKGPIVPAVTESVKILQLLHQGQSRPFLIFLSGDELGRVVRLKEQLRVGRAEDCEVHVEDGAVSRYHARFSYSNDHILLEDLGSRNGTFVGGKAVLPGRPRVIFPGSQIQLGRRCILKVDFLNAIEEDYHEALYTSGTQDWLTGLANRPALLNALSREIARSHRQESDLGIAMVDIDHFKKLNDQHGHLMGDQALAAVAQTLQATVRDSDLVARFGGEEFCIVLPECGKHDAEVIGERMRSAISSLSFTKSQHHDPSIKLTISLGICVANLENRSIASDLLHEADNALYRAKNQGRNRCEVIQI